MHILEIIVTNKADDDAVKIIGDGLNGWAGNSSTMRLARIAQPGKGLIHVQGIRSAHACARIWRHPRR
ncbi:hypothetical protein ACUXPM_001123 [Ralstonia sp. 151470066-2]